MSSHSFVDETKRRGHLLVASAVVPGELDSTRRMLRGLVLPGHQRLHMKNERDSHKRSLATAIAVSGTSVGHTCRGLPGTDSEGDGDG